jgi:glucan phosphoethanolaminetransferase (alkaline phosphatase superfamily)
MDSPIREVTRWQFIAILICSFMLTYVIPPAWIRNLPGMSSLLQWMFDHLPALTGHVQKSHFPEVAAIYFPLMWLLSPLFFFWRWQESMHAEWRMRFDVKPIRTFLRLLFATAFLFFFAYGSYLAGGYQLDSIPWNESKIALFIAAPMAAGGAFFGWLGFTLSGYKTLFKL